MVLFPKCPIAAQLGKERVNQCPTDATENEDSNGGLKWMIAGEKLAWPISDDSADASECPADDKCLDVACVHNHLTYQGEPKWLR